MADLKEILKGIADDFPVPSREIIGAVSDNRKIAGGELFAAFRGLHFDARTLIPDAVKRGAAAVVYEADDGFVPESAEVPLIPVRHLDSYEADIASRVYGRPSGDISLIGITGTNGKSTITHLIAAWSQALGSKTGVMGTLGTGFYPDLKPSPNTTLRPLDLERTLREMVSAGARAVAMEVSSHGLAQGRVRNLSFSAGGFTNLSRDHLDFHKTMENYREAKFELFKMLPEEMAVINAGDETGREFLRRLPGALAFSRDEVPGFSGRLVFAEDVSCHAGGITVRVNGSYGRAELTVPLLGLFNAENLLCALGIMLVRGFSLADLERTANCLRPVMGRMECFRKEGKPVFIVDYAHTPDGLEKAIQGLRAHGFNRIITVCGCGGDRDQGKRPIMGKIACLYSDKVFFTDDNPRTEDHLEILKMMVAGVPENAVYQIIPDRESAIREAYAAAEPGDAVLVAGKGHEDYQIIGTVKHHYSDRETAVKILEGEA